MRCPGCQKEIDDAAWFCPYCSEAQPRDALSTIVEDDLASTAGDTDDLVDPTATLFEALGSDGAFSDADPFAPESTALDPGPASVLRRTRAGSTTDLTPDEALVMTWLDRPRVPDALASSGMLEPSALEMSLVALRAKGLVEFAPAPPSALETLPDDPPSWSSSAPLERLPELGAPHTIVDEGIAEMVRRELEEEARARKGADSVALHLENEVERAAPRPAELRVGRRKIAKIHDGGDQELVKSGLADGILRLELKGKAEELVKLAHRDIKTGAVVSARMNLRLAAALSPDDPRVAAALEELERSGRGPKNDANASAAMKRYEEARQLENQGEYDRAITQLNAAIHAEERGIFYHRLGMILAVHKRELDLGERMLRRAIAIEPSNRAFSAALAKLLSVKAVRDEAKADKSGWEAHLKGKKSGSKA